MKQFNINELLEYKKELEAQITEKNTFTTKDLTYSLETFTDTTRRGPGKTRINEVRPKRNLNEFTAEVNGLVEELAKVKIVIHKHNAVEVIELLQKRESARKKILILEIIKRALPKDSKTMRQPLRMDKDNVLIEFVDTKTEPMFDANDVEKQLNQNSAEERKLNTEIQKLNLNAKITL